VSTTDLAAPETEFKPPRAVTTDEVLSYEENGWVKLNGLIPVQTASAMQQWFETRMGKNAEKSKGVAGGSATSSKFARMWSKYNSPSEESELFSGFAKSPEMAHLGTALMGRDAVRFWADTALIKPPGVGEAGVTPWHQDTPNQPHDRSGLLTIWIALVDITPERGTMRFLSGSHREASLGEPFKKDPVEVYPWLREKYKESEPLHLKAGDATVHNGYVCHAAPPNSTDEVRWVYSISLIDALTCWTGYPKSWVADTKGLEIGTPFDHPAFPILG
jgi:ectoine hydroxylase-related dioxygenase (phytanoyl-CoA dioxygenase family)